MSMRLLKSLSTFTLIAALASPCFAREVDKEKIQHIIVISLENHSFDNLFGSFPKAEGIARGKKTALQTDDKGVPYKTLPVVMDTRTTPPIPDKRFPENLHNQPFAIGKYIKASDKTGDLVHRFYQEQAQIHGGKMDRFANVSDAGGLAMGYYDGSSLKLWDYAKRFTLADHFFHAAYGGSFLNHFWLICACTPRFKDAPTELVEKEIVTKDGYAVNTVFSQQEPHPPLLNDKSKLLPPQTLPTIGDRLNEKNIDWAWYSGGWNDALANKAHASFQYHHQPFAYFKNYGNGSSLRKKHLKDESDFLDALKNNTLPAVAFYKPLGEFNMHPEYSDVAAGDAKIAEILAAIEQSPVWENSVVIVTFDENGGFWDHVPPPKGDRFGPGVRVPTLIISPLAKKNFVDPTLYDTTSILKFIAWRYDLKPLGKRDAKAHNLLNALELN